MSQQLLFLFDSFSPSNVRCLRLFLQDSRNPILSIQYIGYLPRFVNDKIMHTIFVGSSLAPKKCWILSSLAFASEAKTLSAGVIFTFGSRADRRCGIGGLSFSRPLHFFPHVRSKKTTRIWESQHNSSVLFSKSLNHT